MRSIVSLFRDTLVKQDLVEEQLWGSCQLGLQHLAGHSHYFRLKSAQLKFVTFRKGLYCHSRNG